MKIIYLNFPVTFTSNLAGTQGPNSFFPVILVCQQLQRPFLNLEQNYHTHTIFPDASASGGFALSCEHKPAIYITSIFLHVCVSCKWTQINCVFLPLWMWPSWMAITPAGCSEVRDSDGLIYSFNPQQEETPSQNILAFFSLAVAIVFLDLVRFLQVWLDDMSNPPYPPSLCTWFCLYFMSKLFITLSKFCPNPRAVAALVEKGCFQPEILEQKQCPGYRAGHLSLSSQSLFLVCPLLLTT